MPIQITLPWARTIVWLDNNLCVYEVHPPKLKWMMGKDFWRVCAPWVKRKGGKLERLRPTGQMFLPLTLGRR